MESAMTREEERRYPPLKSITIGIFCSFAFWKTISSLAITPLGVIDSNPKESPTKMSVPLEI